MHTVTEWIYSKPFQGLAQILIYHSEGFPPLLQAVTKVCLMGSCCLHPVRARHHPLNPCLHKRISTVWNPELCFYPKHTHTTIYTGEIL